MMKESTWASGSDPVNELNEYKNLGDAKKIALGFFSANFNRCKANPIMNSC